TLTLGAQSTEYRVPSASSEIGPLGTQVEMGMLRSGDCDGNNLITVPDFVILKNAFGKGVGEPGYDNRADITGDRTIGSTDFIQLKNNFGLGGAPPIR